MPNPTLLLALIIAAALPHAGASELRLTTSVQGQPQELAGVDEKLRLLVGPSLTPVAKGATWTLSGDLRAHAALLRWAPVYQIRRADERNTELMPDKPWRAIVHVRHTPATEGPLPKDLVPLLTDWPTGLPKGGVAVAAWIVGGEPVDVILLPLPSTEKAEPWGFAAEFRLTADQAGSGQPVLLLWQDGAFEAPLPQFDSPTAAEAFVATRLDDAAALDKALAAGARVDALSRNGLSLAHYAADAGAVACLSALTQRQPKLVNQPDKNQWTPLHHAAAQGRLSAVNVLIAAKAQVNTKASGVLPPLFQAVDNGHIDIVAVLLDKRAAVKLDNLSANPLKSAIERGDADIAELLTAAKARYDFKSQNAGRQLLLAAVRGHLTMVRWLVARGVDPNSDIQGTTALALAATDGDAASAQALLTAGAQVNKATKEGYTPLMAAARAGNLEYARVLLGAGADPRATASGGTTALHLAAQANADTVIELLLERGADMNARTKADYTALETALIVGAPRAARALSRHGATIALSHSAAETLLAAAVRHDVSETIEAALREGWPADSTFAGVWPAVRVAEIFKSERCLKVLLDAGARPPDATHPMPLVSVKDLDEPIKAVRNAPLVDPRGADEVFPETVVRVSLLIDAQGRPLFPKVDETSDSRLGQAAIESLSNHRFTSLRRQGEPVAVRIQIPVSFVASTNRTYELDRVTQVPVPVKQVTPQFPYDLNRRGITGRVELAFIVGTDGKPYDIEVLRATHPDFAQAAVAALSDWVFKPGSIDGRPVRTKMKQPMSFTLNED